MNKEKAQANQFIITDEEVEKIKDFLRNRNTLQIRKTLNELKPFREEKSMIREELGALIRNSGRSNMISIEKLRNLVSKYEREDKMPEDEETEEDPEETEEE